MKRIFMLAIIIILSFCTLGCNEQLNVYEYVTESDTKITFKYIDLDGYKIKVPTNLFLMSEETIKLKYPSEKRPKIVYTNEDASINIALENGGADLKDSQIIEYTKQMEKIYKNFGTIKSIDYFNKDNHQIGEIKLITSAIDTEIYNHMIFFSINDKLGIINFNCTIEHYNEWEEISELVINSIRFN